MCSNETDKRGCHLLRCVYIQFSLQSHPDGAECTAPGASREGHRPREETETGNYYPPETRQNLSRLESNSLPLNTEDEGRTENLHLQPSFISTENRAAGSRLGWEGNNHTLGDGEAEAQGNLQIPSEYRGEPGGTRPPTVSTGLTAGREETNSRWEAKGN